MPCPCLLLCAHRVLRVLFDDCQHPREGCSKLEHCTSTYYHMLIERTRTSTVIDACFLFWHYDITPRPICWDLASPHPVFISDTETLSTSTELQKATRLVSMAEHSILSRSGDKQAICHLGLKPLLLIHRILQSRLGHWMRRLSPTTPYFYEPCYRLASHPHIGTSTSTVPV
ncbi:hypothetical protein GGI42DRAFT_38732 [Trichoderma sp. SZMC 28013]